MAEVGSIHIAGSIDVSNIKHGLKEISNSLKNMKDSAEGSFGDISRLGSGLANIATSLLKIGVGLVATALGIAALSPQVAPELAKMEIAFEKLTRIIGSELKPVFAEFAKLFVGFVEWLGTDGRPVLEFLKDILLTILTEFNTLGTNAAKAYKEIKKLLDLLDPERDKPSVPEKITVSGKDVYLTEEEKGAFGTASTIVDTALSVAGLASGYFETLARGDPFFGIPAAVLNLGEAGALTMQDMLREMSSGSDIQTFNLGSLFDRFFANYEKATPDYTDMRYKNYGGN